MKKFIVTHVLYQDIIIEAENAEEAERIALYETMPDQWDDPSAEGDLYVEEYEGDKTPFNQKEYA